MNINELLMLFLTDREKTFSSSFEFLSKGRWLKNLVKGLLEHPIISK
jgi:hypothetical protein